MGDKLPCNDQDFKALTTEDETRRAVTVALRAERPAEETAIRRTVRFASLVAGPGRGSGAFRNERATQGGRGAMARSPTLEGVRL